MSSAPDGGVIGRTGEVARALARAPLLLARARMLPPRPAAALRSAAALRHGAGLSGLVALNAAWSPDRSAVIDEQGSVSFSELDRRAAQIAGGLSRLAPGEAATLAVMCRNHVGLVETLVAGARLGWKLTLVNYELSGPQLAAVLEREDPSVLVHDDEFTDRLADAVPNVPRVVADDDGAGATSLSGLVADSDPAAPVRRSGGFLLLTSGTTGLPKGVPRDPSLLDGLATAGVLTSVLDRTSIRARQPVLTAPPGFHAFGLAGIALGLGLGGGVILRRRFDAEAALAAIERQRAGVAMFVPAMLRRILDLPADVRRRYDLSSARTVITGAAPLLPSLYEAFTNEYGDVLHNGYGTTEVGLGAFASPADLRAAPGTIGRPPDAIPVRVLDASGRVLPAGEVGGLYVGGRMVLKAYSGGGELADRVGSLYNTGDLAHTDGAGRIFIDGRQDDMIVSGGENVFPQEVEDVLLAHGGVRDAAVVGVTDEEFGQRLRGFVVLGADAGPSEEQLLAHVRERLERYKTPRELVFVDEIPRNATGKIMRRELTGAAAG